MFARKSGAKNTFARRCGAKIEGNEEGKSLAQENLCKSGIFARKIGANLIMNKVYKEKRHICTGIWSKK
jgi:hypothetical protein